RVRDAPGPFHESSEAALGPVAPAVFQAPEQSAAGGATAHSARGAAVDGAELDVVDTALRLDGERGGQEHDDEADHADDGLAGDGRVDDQGQPHDDNQARDDHATARVEPWVAAAHSRGELGVLGKRSLDLLEQSLLVL